MDAEVANNEPFVREAGAGRTLNVLGVTHIYKAMATDTAGLFSFWENVVPPGCGAPPHVHAHEDEAFYVLSGEIQIEMEGEPAPRSVGPGGFVYAARRKRHAYRNVSGKAARVLVMCTPSCGLDQMFEELDAIGARGKPAIEEVAAIAAKYGVAVAVESPAGQDTPLR